MEKKQLLAIVGAILGNTFWGLSFLFTRVALQETTPEVMLSIRFIIAFAMLNVPLLLGKQKISLRGKRLLPLAGMAVAEPICFFAESYGILYTNATFAGVIVAVAPVFAIGLAALLLKEYPSRRQMLYCCLPVAGVIIMVLAGKSLGVVTPLGVFFLLLNCGAIAFYRLFNRWAGQEFTSYERTYIVLAVCTVVFTLSALATSGWDVSVYAAPLTSARFMLPILALCLLCSVGSNMLVNYAASQMTVAKMSVFGSLITVVSTFAGILILKEPFSLALLVGTAMIIFGIWQVSRPEKTK